jgi:hypothetical protein
VGKAQSRDDKKAAEKARRTAAVDAQQLRSELLGVIGEVCSLVPKEKSLSIVAASTTLGPVVRGIADALEGQDGTEHEGIITVLGSISDLARRKMIPKERDLPFETPSEILRFFALVMTLATDPSLALKAGQNRWEKTAESKGIKVQCDSTDSIQT